MTSNTKYILWISKNKKKEEEMEAGREGRREGWGNSGREGGRM